MSEQPTKNKLPRWVPVLKTSSIEEFNTAKARLEAAKIKTSRSPDEQTQSLVNAELNTDSASADLHQQHILHVPRPKTLAALNLLYPAYFDSSLEKNFKMRTGRFIFFAGVLLMLVWFFAGKNSS